MTTTKLKYLLMLGILLVLGYIFFAGPSPLNRVIAETMNNNSTPFQCKISLAGKAEPETGAWIQFTIANNGDQDLELLSWYTPFEGFMAELFVIQDTNNQAVIYQGPKVKRLLPRPSDFISVPARSELDTRLDLTLVYNLTPGKYSVSLMPRRLEYKTREPDAELQPFYCPAETLTLEFS